MPVVAMPDGTEVKFPDDMPADNIKSLIARKFPNEIRAGEKSGWSDYVPKEIADIPSEISDAFGENFQAAKEGFAPSGGKAQQGVIGGLMATGRGMASIPGMVLAPITGAARSVGGHLLARAEEGIGGLINPNAKVTSEQLYSEAKSGVDQAMMAMRPARGGLGPRGAPPTPPQPIPTGPLDVILSEGQATRELPLIQREQAALRGTSGPAAQARAQEFADQQAQQVVKARDTVTTGLDQFGQKIVASPQEAVELAQKSIQTIAGQRKAGVSAAYDEANALPGEIHAGAFEGITNKIKSDLSAGDNPVIIDDKLTPFASRAIQDVENRISQLKVQNRADPFGQPSQEDIQGLTLKAVDQMRRRLSSFRSDAYKSGNAADGRAASAVVDAFDAQVDSAVNGGLFRGDPRAVQAWNDARAAHADYKSTFSAGKNDPAGRVVERILGKGNNPAAIPNDVADFLYGSSGVNPGSLNVSVSNRVKRILGEQSPEWSGVKQGLFSRLVETPEGVADMGPGKIAQRINQFLNGGGKELSEVMFSPVERALIKQYGELSRSLEVPQAGANWSNSATFLVPLLKSASSRMSSLIVGVLSHIPVVGKVAGPVAGAMIDNMGGAVSNAANAKQIVKQMPLVSEAARKFQAAVAAYNKANSAPSRVSLGIAASNLSRAFRQIGVDFSMPSMSKAEDQQGVPRPPGQ
jgi:hypothetical protein